MSSHRRPSGAAPIDAADVVYRRASEGATRRNVSAVLSDTISVRDFGAVGDCFCTRGARPPLTEGGLAWPGWYEEACCPHDDTAAFITALAAVSDSEGVHQVEGKGYIRSLEHGLPARRVGLREPRVEAVDDEPVLLAPLSNLYCIQ
jgi:hypothetical protein